jgi:hypothetical protein
LLTGKSFDLLPYIRAGKLPIQEVDWQPVANSPERNQLAEIFII